MKGVANNRGSRRSNHALWPSLGLLLMVAARAQDAPSPPPGDRMLQFVLQFCAHCHAEPEPEGGLDLLELLRRPAAGELEALLELADRLEARDMPPASEPQPPQAAVTSFAAWVNATIQHEVSANHARPGRVTVRRLSRVEYDNTIRDLFGVATQRSQSFPNADLGYGFDNIGDALSFSTLHLEKYAAAAEDVAEQTILTEDPDHPPVQYFEAEDMICSLGDRFVRGDYVTLISHGNVRQQVELPRAGDYLIRTSVCGDQAGADPARMAIAVDGRAIERIDVPQRRGEPATHTVRVHLDEGPHVIHVAFVNDYYRPDDPDPRNRDRNLHVDWVEVTGPVDTPTSSVGHRWIFADDDGASPPAARARPVVAELMRRTWRRPPTKAEVDRLAQVVARSVERGANFAEGVRLALEAALVSPNFLFRLEPTAVDDAANATELDGYALATRLSYFLWSSSPDTELLEHAATGTLGDPQVLIAQARRLLGDARARALAENFAAQWLELRRLDTVTPDHERFPSFDAELRADMRRETEMFFECVLREKRRVRELLDADYSFLNERLAAHYDVPGVSGRHLRRVNLLDPARGGLLGHASFQTLTSHPTRTSPVKRGKWILDNLLDDPPSAPPPGNDSFDQEQVGHLLTLREKMAAHRANPACAVCHNRMDPLGIALQNFDAIGRWRTSEAGLPIDPTGVLPGGRTVDSPAQLKRLLAQGNAFARGLATKLFTYGIGRPPSAPERATLRELVRLKQNELTLEELLLGIIQLDAFRRRETAR